MNLTFFEDPISNPNPSFANSSGSGIDWNALIPQWNAIGSQAIAAWGRNPTQQIAGSNVFGIGQGYSPAAINASQAQIQSAIASQNAGPYATRPGTTGTGIGSGVDGIINWVGQNPLPVLVGVVGLVLLFRQPPGKR